MDKPAPLLLPPPPRGFSEAIALFLDLDGTLAALRQRPELVEIPPSLVALLDRLAAALDGALAILSGRSLEQIDALVAPLHLPAAGLHGGDVRFPDGRHLRFEPTPQLRGAVRGACNTLMLPAGTWVEEKSGVCFALHFRESPDAGDELLRQAQRIAARTRGGYCVQRGDCVVELKPAGRDKGTAVRRLMESGPFLTRMPVAVGDDLTDEHAFRECQSWDGAGIVVGEREPSCADYRLASPEAVHAWLEQLTAGMEEKALERLAGDRVMS